MQEGAVFRWKQSVWVKVGDGSLCANLLNEPGTCLCILCFSDNPRGRVLSPAEEAAARLSGG